MKKTIKKALTLLSVYYAKMLEYRSELILWVLSGSLPMIMMGIWVQAAESGKFGFKPVDFARYFFAVFLAKQISIVWVIYDFEQEVVEGKLSPKLLQPIDPVWHHVADHLAERCARMPFILLLAMFFFVLYPQAFWLPSIANLLLFILAAIMKLKLLRCCFIPVLCVALYRLSSFLRVN